MGVGVSRSNLARSVAKAGGIGIISGAQIGYDERIRLQALDDETIGAILTLEPLVKLGNLLGIPAPLRSLRKHISKAKEISDGGIIGVNLMVAMNNYEEYVKGTFAIKFPITKLLIKIISLLKKFKIILLKNSLLRSI